jgi:hypothetical protein
MMMHEPLQAAFAPRSYARGAMTQPPLRRGSGAALKAVVAGVWALGACGGYGPLFGPAYTGAGPADGGWFEGSVPEPDDMAPEPDAAPPHGVNADAMSTGADLAPDQPLETDALVADAGGAPSTPTELGVIIFYTPHGTILDAWRPSGTDAAYTFGPILKPLEPFRHRITVLDGIDNLVAPGVPATTHQSGPAVLLTGRGLPPMGSGYYLGGGPSLDSLLLQVSPRAPFTSLRLGVDAPEDGSGRGVTWSGPGAALLPENDPRRTCLSVLAPLGLECATPIPPMQPPVLPLFSGQQIWNLVQAFAFGQTRFATLSYLDVSSTTATPWLDNTMGYAALADASAGGAARASFTNLQTWFAREFAILLEKLDAVPDGDATLLDHTVVVWLSETGEASRHSGRNIPVVLAGGLNGALKTGHYLHLPGRSQVDLLWTILVAATGSSPFGDSTLATGPIVELLAH